MPKPSSKKSDLWEILGNFGKISSNFSEKRLQIRFLSIFAALNKDKIPVGAAEIGPQNGLFLLPETYQKTMRSPFVEFPYGVPC